MHRDLEHIRNKRKHMRSASGLGHFQGNDLSRTTKAFAAVKGDVCSHGPDCQPTWGCPVAVSGAEQSAEGCWEMASCASQRSPGCCSRERLQAELSDAKHFSHVYSVKNCRGGAKSN